MQDWYDFRSRCPAFYCTPFQDICWVHTKCEECEKINAYGMIQCLKDRRGNKCLNPTFILELSFKCINYEEHIDDIDDKKFDGITLDAILIAMKITTIPKKIRKDIIKRINDGGGYED